MHKSIGPEIVLPGGLAGPGCWQKKRFSFSTNALRFAEKIRADSCVRNRDRCVLISTEETSSGDEGDPESLPENRRRDSGTAFGKLLPPQAAGASKAGESEPGLSVRMPGADSSREGESGYRAGSSPVSESDHRSSVGRGGNSRESPPFAFAGTGMRRAAYLTLISPSTSTTR